MHPYFSRLWFAARGQVMLKTPVMRKEKMNEAEKSGIVKLDSEISEEGDVLPGEVRLLEEDEGLTEYAWALCDGEGGRALPVGTFGR